MRPRLAYRFCRNEAGSVAVYFALLAPFLIGFVALGTEAGFWLMAQRKIQHAADIAAYSAATRIAQGSDGATITAAATSTALGSGALPDDTVTVNPPPLAGAFAGEDGYVEVVISRTLPRYFSALFGGDSVTLSARAVAGVLEDGYPVCMLALNTGASPAMSFSGSSVATFDGCSIATNSVTGNSFEMQGAKVEVSAGCIDTVGGIDPATLDSSGLTLTDPNCETGPRTYQLTIADPYADQEIPDPADYESLAPGPSTIRDDTHVHNGQYLSFPPVPMSYFPGGLLFRDTATLPAGLYIVDGGALKINANATVIGDGVSFLLVNGALLDIAGTSTLKLSAPTSGPFSGMLFFSPPGDLTANHKINGTASSVLNGVIHLPTGNVDFQGNAGTSAAGGCIQILANTIEFTGNSEISMNCDLPGGGQQVVTNQTIALVE